MQTPTVDRTVALVLSEDALPVFDFPSRAPAELYPLSLHDALPIYPKPKSGRRIDALCGHVARRGLARDAQSASDRKSTRLNSSHTVISYAVFCLKKKK